MKKTEVYVKIDTPKKAKKLKKLLDMFGEKVYEGRVWHNDGYPYYSFDYDREYWAGDSLRDSKDLGNKTKVSIKELRNILAKEHLKEGDVCLFDDRKGFKSIGVFDKYSEEYTDFLVSKVPGKDSVRYGFHDFIRYATEEEKALLEPKKELKLGKWYKGVWERPTSNFTNSDIAIVERLHDTLLDNHGYSLQSELLIDARYLADKIKSNIK